MKKISMNGLGKKVIPAATVALGFASAKVIPAIINKVSPKTNTNNTIIGASQILVGILLSNSKNQHLSNAGLGVAVSGFHTFLAGPVDSALKAAGLAGIPAYYRAPIALAGVSQSVNGINCPGVKTLN